MYQPMLHSHHRRLSFTLKKQVSNTQILMRFRAGLVSPRVWTGGRRRREANRSAVEFKLEERSHSGNWSVRAGLACWLQKWRGREGHWGSLEETVPNKMSCHDIARWVEALGGVGGKLWVRLQSPFLDGLIKAGKHLHPAAQPQRGRERDRVKEDLHRTSTDSRETITTTQPDDPVLCGQTWHRKTKGSWESFQIKTGNFPESGGMHREIV